MRGVLTQEQKQLAFRLREQGLSLVEIARQVGCTAPMVGLMVRDGLFLTGLPDPWQPRPGRLNVLEREQVLLGLARGESTHAVEVTARHVSGLNSGARLAADEDVIETSLINSDLSRRRCNLPDYRSGSASRRIY